MNLPTLFCVRCSLQFDKESDLKKHVVSKQHMKKHVEPIHEEKLNKERDQTKEEPKSSENEPNLGLEKVTYRCGICDSSLETKIILDQHYNASYNEMLFTCNVCEYSFSQKGNLKLYVELVQEGKKPTKNDREKHVDLVHEKKRPFKCEICNKHFIKKSHMKEHVEIVHENKKLFKCGICDYGSSRRGDLKRHVVSAHEEKKHVVSAHGEMKVLKCKLCPFICSTRYFMKKHVESVHENEKPIEM